MNAVSWRRARAAAVSTVVLVAAVAVTGAAAGAAPTPVPVGPAIASAASAASALVASRPGNLHAGPDEAFVAGPVSSSLGWSYVPYERTYRSLPVIGGDFVVVTDQAGRVNSTSVAPGTAITGLATTPKLTQAAAEKIAAGQLTTVTAVGGSRLVVFALDSTPTLAWESTVDGLDDRISELTVDVDANTGAVLRRHEDLLFDSGTSSRNGPNPISIATTVTGGTHLMKDPVVKNLSCGYLPNKTILSNTTGVWGDGDRADKETACLDAMFAAQTENKMLSQWLGRNSFDGTGGAWPIYVGENAIDAHYQSGGDPQVQLGYDFSNDWMSQLDVVAHEMGHGVDDHTPGGVSGNGTAEFVADVFGTATEWYANEPAPFDTPDYQTGDLTAIASRYMFAPPWWSVSGCYSSATSTMDPHDAAAVGDHWFYLLAEGSNPIDGQPVSPTCNGASQSGIGVQKALQILYNAMLLKTSNSSYPTYRNWTLTAAKNLYPNDCTTYNLVKAAWDAVSVFAQSNQPSCQAGPPVAGPEVVANTGAENQLRVFGTDGTIAATGWTLAPGSSPAVALLATGGFETAFQSAGNGTLRTVGPNGSQLATGAPMAPNTNPAIAALLNGGFKVAFNGSDNQLRILASDGTITATGLGVAPGTSPAIAALTTGGVEIVFQAYGSGHLWVVDVNGVGHDTGWIMAAGSSPSIAALVTSGAQVAFVGSDGLLYELAANGQVMITSLGVAAGSSPAIAALATGGAEATFKASTTNHLWVLNSNGTGIDFGVVLAANTNPAIAAGPTSGFFVAYVADRAGGLVTVWDGGTNFLSPNMALAPNTSPSIATYAPPHVIFIDMPNLLGMDQASATVQINKVGLTLGSISNDNRCIDVAGTVLVQNPIAGVHGLLPGTPVTLTVSTGKNSKGKNCVFN